MESNKVQDYSNFCVSMDATLLDAIAKIESNRSRAALVVSEGKVMGVISEGDILRAMLKGADVYSPIRSFTQKNIKYLFEENFEEIFNFVKQFGVSMIPILNKDFSLRKVIRLSDLLEKLELKG